MVKLEISNLSLRVRFSYPAPVLPTVVQWIGHGASTSRMWVRFLPVGPADQLGIRQEV